MTEPRFQQLNALLSQSGLSPREALEALSGKHYDIFRLKKEIAPFFHPEAACRPVADHDTDYLQRHAGQFFVERGASTRPAKDYCVGCVAVQDCLEYALKNKERHGIWGGMGERDRRRVLRAINDKGLEAGREVIEKRWRINRIERTFDMPEDSQALISAAADDGTDDEPDDSGFTEPLAAG